MGLQWSNIERRKKVGKKTFFPICRQHADYSYFGQDFGDFHLAHFDVKFHDQFDFRSAFAKASYGIDQQADCHAAKGTVQKRVQPISNLLLQKEQGRMP